jgi:hypothetical protein
VKTKAPCKLESGHGTRERLLDIDFYEKAHFVKPTWRLLSVAEAQLLISALRAMLLSALFR